MIGITRKTINVRGELMDLSKPRVMGILNATPDSFYSNSRVSSPAKVAKRLQEMLEQGADFIDIGAYSTRPGADFVSEEVEIHRFRSILNLVRREFPQAILSIDTFRAKVARICVEEYGAAIINDISAGEWDKEMFDTIAKLQVPYIAMHLTGTPFTMHEVPTYKNMRQEIMLYFARKLSKLKSQQIHDVIIDPGLGFSKTLEQNYEILAHLNDFNILDSPMLIGVSRKRMIWQTLGTDPQGSLNGTTVLNTQALLGGANILRVHDVKEAVEAVKIVEILRRNQ